jgi:hypothetical protein
MKRACCPSLLLKENLRTNRSLPTGLIVGADLGSADPQMLTATLASVVVVSGIHDTQNQPLDADGIIDDAEYAHIMRRIGREGEPSVSAFNSSI